MGEAEGTIAHFQGWGEKGGRGEGKGAGRLAEGSTAHRSIHAPCTWRDQSSEALMKRQAQSLPSIKMTF